MNELANLAEIFGADIEQVRQGIGSDTRIGYHFIYPGCGYGGSCFPKDVKALEKTAQEYGYNAELLTAVESVNNRQKQLLFKKILKHYQDDIKGKTFALWGLAFKPKTDDMREAPSRVLLEALIDAGATVRAFDPEAMHEARKIYADKTGLILCQTQDEALKGANALCVVTEWKNFWSPDFEDLKAELSDAVIFDGRNLYNPDTLKKLDITYYGIGR
jgi:UDPglucose 6-dehydrogenase